MRTLVFVTCGIQTHPTDTEHKWPWGTDGEHVTSEAITAPLPTNLSLSCKSHVCSLTPVSHHVKGAGMSLQKGQSIKLSVHSLQSFFPCRALGWVGIGSRNSACPPLSVPTLECTSGSKHYKKTSLEAMRNKGQMKFSPLTLPPRFANSLEILVIM